jgi:hypothetical protein
LRTNLTGESEQELWHMYMQLNDAEAAFRTLKQDLSIRPVFHQIQRRVEAHVLVCFIAYAMYRTLDRMAFDNGLDMSARKVLSAVSTIRSGDVILPLVDGRELRLRRVSRPDTKQAELLLAWASTCPNGSEPTGSNAPFVVQTFEARSYDFRHLSGLRPLYCATSASYGSAAPPAGGDAGPDGGPYAGVGDAGSDIGPDAGVGDAGTDGGPDAGGDDACADVGPGDDAPTIFTLTVISPNGSESWANGSTHDLTWDVSSTVSEGAFDMRLIAGDARGWARWTRCWRRREQCTTVRAGR